MLAFKNISFQHLDARNIVVKGYQKEAENDNDYFNKASSVSNHIHESVSYPYIVCVFFGQDIVCVIDYPLEFSWLSVVFYIFNRGSFHLCEFVFNFIVKNTI